MTHVTLNCDGSLDFTQQGNFVKAGWAYWISSDIGKFKSYGRCPDCDNPMGPELAAIAKGVYFIRNHPELSKAKKIIVNTDCEPGINWMRTIHRKRARDKKHKGSLQNVARHHILEMTKKGYKDLPEVKVTYSHVKGHTNNLNEARKWVNDWLDKKAKEGRFLNYGDNIKIV